MIKVCHVTSAHQRYDGRIFRKECISLVKAGYDCYFIVNDNKPDEIKNGVHIVSTGFLAKSRRDRFFRSYKGIEKKIKEVSAEIYHFHDPDLLALAYKMKKNGKTVIFDFHENVSEQIKDKTWIPKILRNRVSFIYKRYEYHYASKFDALITVSPNLGKYYKKINPFTEIITNYPIIENEYKSPQFCNRNVCFCGGISEQWCHEKILEALENIENCTYVLAGQADEKYLWKLRQKSAWDRVKFLGLIPFEKVSEIYQNSMLGLALNISTQIGKEGSLGNTKLFEYMMAGIPVICSDNKLWKEIVEKYQCGIAVNPSDSRAIAHAIRRVLDDPDRARMMGGNGRKAVLKQYNWSKEERKLFAVYKEVIA